MVVLRKFDFEGHEIEYDESVLLDYRCQKVMARGDVNGFFGVLEKLYVGRDEEYADLFGGTMEQMTPLIKATIDDAGSAVKNSRSSQSAKRGTKAS